MTGTTNPGAVARRETHARRLVKPVALRLAASVLLAGGLTGTPASADEPPIDYTKQIRPILASRCFTCHGATQQKSGLRLDVAQLALKTGGANGPIAEPNKPEESLIVDAITGTNGLRRMPLDDEPLSDEQISLIKAWIAQGAAAPEEKIPPDPRDHWAFRPPVRIEPAALGAAASVPADWQQNPVDRFLGARLTERGLHPVEPADKRTLIRRVYLDLIGIPPTRAQVAEFLADESPDAYERIVDRLLASPQYGERWGRHWMDVWRYSDWDGYGAEVRESQPHVWRWRDWIIESLNEDKPYDRMIVEMLAGDEVAPDDPQTVRATGFLVRNWYKFNRNVWIDNTIEHTSKAFLGITLNCARCHDHMYDPITQVEYYRFRAYFEPHQIRTDRVPGQPDPAVLGLARVYDADAAAPTFLFRRGNEKEPDKDHPLTPGVPAILTRGQPDPQPVSLPVTSWYPGAQEFVRQETLAQAEMQLAAARTKEGEAQAALEAARTAAAGDAAAGDAASGEKDDAPAALVEDDFSQPRPDVWETSGGEWEYAGGKLLQKKTGSAMARLVSKTKIPRDFIARFKFKTTGGDQWKSVGLSWDMTGDERANSAYLSAVDGGSKLQVFLRRAGQDQYPNDAAHAVAVELGREYELTVACRDTLVNVSLDGKLLVKYRVPDRYDGAFALWAFDAAAEFLSVSVRSLSPKELLIDKDGKPVGPAANVLVAEQTAALRTAERAAAEAQFEAVSARIAADRGRYSVPEAPNVVDLAVAASRADRMLTLRQAELTRLQKRQALEKLEATAAAGEAAAKALEEARKELAAAEKAVEAAAKALEAAAAGYQPLSPVYPQTSTGRRTALARWIADPQHPLTARVAVNQIWMRHFGQPLVPTVFDFGNNGKPPTHPELLDWLAVEFMESGWRMKPLHRLLVTSRAYRLSSQAGPAHPGRTLDPENALLWRMNVRRAEAEVVRDATLAAAGSLDLTAGGPDLDPAQGMTVPRRSVYFRTSKEKKMTFLALFDSANVTECYRRSESVVPQQALAMANSPLTLTQSRKLAAALSQETASADRQDEAFVAAAFEQILGRSATAEESRLCVEYLAQQRALFERPEALTRFTTGAEPSVKPASDPRQRAREGLVHVLFNHNDFVTIR